MALQRLSQATARLAARRPGTIVLVTLVVTLGFVGALAAIPAVPSSDSFQGSGPAADAEARIERDLPPTGFAVPFIAGAEPARGTNVLSRAVFDEILALEEVLRRDPALQPYLFEYRHPHLQIEVSSIHSLPDTLRAVMDGDTPLSYAVGWHSAAGGPGTSYGRATDAEFQDALDRLLSFEPVPGERPFRRAVSVDGAVVDGVWTARSLFIVPTFHYATVFTDYTRDPGAVDDDTRLIDDLQLYVQDVLRANARDTEWIGIGLGINDEVEREVAESGRLVLLSFVLIGMFLYLTLRNGRDWVTAYLALPLVIIWMLGGARLLGLSVNQFTAMLPVLILALGVDYAIHGVRRYREERGAHPPAAAITRSISLLGPALLLASGTTATAFLSNGFSRVEALRDWGLEGGIAILAALWICGVYTPALRHLWDRRRVRKGILADEARASVTARRVREGTILGRLAASSGRHPLPVLAVLALITLPAVVAATQITSDFDANDFLDEDSELIQGVRRVSVDYPDEGEPAIVLVEADVADPVVLSALADATDRFAERGYKPERDFSLVRVVRTAMDHPQENSGDYPDADRNGIPDRRADLVTLLDAALRDGVWARIPIPQPPPPEAAPGVPFPGPLQPGFPDSQRVLVYSASTVRELVHPDGAGGYDKTVVYFGIPGTEDFAVIPKARDDWRDAAEGLYAMPAPAVSAITLTGEPYKRLEMVNAITDSLKISITLSIVVVFLIVFAVFRDVWYALVTVIPVLVLVAWLFAFMVLIGLSLNLVTVTVAAMAIGVGIDYSIHLTERFREEVRINRRERITALRRAMDSSGVALFGSAVTTISGFLVLMLAPMPLFATFGLITAAMAAASFLAAATILPPLLVLVERLRPSG